MAFFTLRLHMETTLIAAVATSLLFYSFLAWLARPPSSGDIENTLRLAKLFNWNSIVVANYNVDPETSFVEGDQLNSVN